MWFPDLFILPLPHVQGCTLRMSPLLCNDRSCCGVSLQEEERSSSRELTLTPAMQTRQALIRTILERKRTCRQNPNGARDPSERLPDSSHCGPGPAQPPLKTLPVTPTPLQSPAATPHSFGVGHAAEELLPEFESLHKIRLLSQRQKPRL